MIKMCKDSSPSLLYVFNRHDMMKAVFQMTKLAAGEIEKEQCYEGPACG